jgi:hypothetical protein
VQLAKAEDTLALTLKEQLALQERKHQQAQAAAQQEAQATQAKLATALEETTQRANRAASSAGSAWSSASAAHQRATQLEAKVGQLEGVVAIQARKQTLDEADRAWDSQPAALASWFRPATTPWPEGVKTNLLKAEGDVKTLLQEATAYVVQPPPQAAKGGVDQMAHNATQQRAQPQLRQQPNSFWPLVLLREPLQQQHEAEGHGPALNTALQALHDLLQSGLHGTSQSLTINKTSIPREVLASWKELDTLTNTYWQGQRKQEPTETAAPFILGQSQLQSFTRAMETPPLPPPTEGLSLEALLKDLKTQRLAFAKEPKEGGEPTPLPSKPFAETTTRLWQWLHGVLRSEDLVLTPKPTASAVGTSHGTGGYGGSRGAAGGEGGVTAPSTAPASRSSLRANSSGSCSDGTCGHNH